MGAKCVAVDLISYKFSVESVFRFRAQIYFITKCLSEELLNIQRACCCETLVSKCKSKRRHNSEESKRKQCIAFRRNNGKKVCDVSQMRNFQTWQLTGDPSSSLLTNTDEPSSYFLSSLFLSLIKICESVVRNFVDNPEISSVL